MITNHGAFVLLIEMQTQETAINKFSINLKTYQIPMVTINLILQTKPNNQSSFIVTVFLPFLEKAFEKKKLKVNCRSHNNEAHCFSELVKPSR